MIWWDDFDYDSLPDFEVLQGKRQQYYLNGDFAVDIESTSFYYDGVKMAYPYLMTVNLCGNIIYCRYLTELQEVFMRLKKRYALSFRKRIIMFVHNLSYEFQFFRDICNFTEVFARSKLKPLKALDSNSCIEFHCSYTISGLKLSKLAENLKSVDIKKLDGEKFDYKKIRHSETPLTDYELEYGGVDVLILHYWILEEIKKNGGKITKIPLTQTGYIRRECREYIFNNVNKKYYGNMIKMCTPDTDCFIVLHKAFAGGDTHGNYLHVRHVVKNVRGYDFASSYPAVMVKCKYPRKFSKMIVKTDAMFENLINRKACVFKIGFEKIKAKRHHHILSSSKCDTYVKKTAILDNGRIVEAEKVITYMTDIDYKDFINYYDFEGRKVVEVYYSDYEYLPKPFVEYILKLFKDKTELKMLTDELSQALYLKSKQHINGLYGMCVTNIANEDAVFTDKWEDKPKRTPKEEYDVLTKILDKYRNSYNSFLLYQWGVWVTCWARHFLRETIAKVEDNSERVDGFVYCDTDSIKLLNWEKHQTIIDDYNKHNKIDMEKAMEFHDLPIDGFTAWATDEDGNKTLVTLGAWEYDGDYKQFKTLGAKRYMYTTQVATSQPEKYHLTNAGLNKQKALPYIIENGGFSFYKKGMVIPAEYTGKATHTYVDSYYYVKLTDYMGIESECQQTHYIHLEEQKYQLSSVTALEEYINGSTISGEPYEHTMSILRTGEMCCEYT